MKTSSENQRQLVRARESRKNKSGEEKSLFFAEFFSPVYEFPSPPLTAPGSARMV